MTLLGKWMKWDPYFYYLAYAIQILSLVDTVPRPMMLGLQSQIFATMPLYPNMVTYVIGDCVIRDSMLREAWWVLRLIKSCLLTWLMMLVGCWFADPIVCYVGAQSTTSMMSQLVFDIPAKELNCLVDVMVAMQWSFVCVFWLLVLTLYFTTINRHHLMD